MGGSYQKRGQRDDTVNLGSNYTEEEVAFLKAADLYKRRLKQKFLNVTDYLHLLKEMGYRKEPANGHTLDH